MKVKAIVRTRVLPLLITLVNINLFAQDIIKGSVKSEDDNLPLVGVTITNRSTNKSTFTNEKGEFTIEGNAQTVLNFSMVGLLPQQITIGNKTYIEVFLKTSSLLLENVVVLGYSQKTQKELSASVVNVSSKELQSVAAPDIQSMLQGKVAGLMVSNSSGAPGAPAEIRIRGINSINVDRPPLTVVDGILGGNYVPSDVESITVLKDAAAIGLYGAAGSGGVIIVSTKQAQKDKSEITFNTRSGFKTVSTGNFSLQNSKTLYETHRQMWGNEVANFLRNRPEELLSVDYNWLNEAFRPANINSYNLGFRGNPSGKSAYSVSIDYFSEQGTLKKTNFDRINFHSNLRSTISSKFQITNDINLQYNRNNQYFYDWLYDSFLYLPWDNPYDLNGNAQYVDPSTPTNWYSRDRRNFLHSMDNNSAKSNGLDVVYSFRALYEINKYLSFESRNRLSATISRYDEFISPLTREGKAISGSATANYAEGRGVISTNLLRFNLSERIDGFVGYEGGYYFTNSLGFSGRNLPQGIKVPGSAAEIVSNSGTNLTTKSMSALFEVNYNKSGKYFASINSRLDGSSLFAKQKRYAFFPSASVAWLLSEEKFLKSKNIGFTKLRISYGFVGNDGFSTAAGGLVPFGYLATYQTSGQYNGKPAAIADNPANDKLGWETSKILNIGIDKSILNDKLNFNIDVFQKNVNGMLFRNPLAYSSGFEFRWENIGAMQSRGIELGITFNHEFGSVKYSGNFNISLLRNTIRKVTDVTTQQFVGSEIRQINQKGKQAFVWFMPKWKGVDTQTGAALWEYLEYDTNGNITNRKDTTNYNAAQSQAISGALPKWNGGFTNSFSYKNFIFSFLISFQGGNQIYHRSRMFFDSDGAYTQYAMMNLQNGWSRWQNPGDNATHPKLERNNTTLSNGVSSRYLEKGDYLRIRNIRLGYNVPTKLTKKLKVANLNAFISADNLYTLTKFSGMDPDINFNLLPWAVPGTSDFKYPINKQFTGGIDISF